MVLLYNGHPWKEEHTNQIKCCDSKFNPWALFLILAWSFTDSLKVNFTLFFFTHLIHTLLNL